MTSAPISPAERALIDEAIAAGRVTFCPPRTFSEWPAEDGARLSLGEARAKAKTAFWGGKPGRKPDPAIEARRRKVSALAAEGLDYRAISARLGISPHLAKVDLYRMRWSPGGAGLEAEAPAGRRA